MAGEEVEEGKEEEEEVVASEEEEEEEEEVSESNGDSDSGSTSSVKSPDDDDRMVLTDEERVWALAIKEAVEEEEDLENLSDFWYGQYATMDKGNVQAALERAAKMQWFRGEYGIVENAETGTNMVRDFVRLLPEFWMALTFNQREGNYVLVLDISKTHNRFGKTKAECLLARMRATYFLNHALSPDFESIRLGSTLLAENEGYEWKKNFGNSEFKRIWAELCGVYPYHFRQVKNFNTPMFFNIIVSMARPFIPKEIHSKFEMGCKCEMGNLGELYLTPTVEAANQRLIESTREALERRYENEDSFFL